MCVFLQQLHKFETRYVQRNTRVGRHRPLFPRFAPLTLRLAYGSQLAGSRTERCFDDAERAARLSRTADDIATYSMGSFLTLCSVAYASVSLLTTSKPSLNA